MVRGIFRGLGPKEITSNSDTLGVFSSALCFLHCLAAPLLFVAHAGVNSKHGAQPWWWQVLDIAFLMISFIAVYWSSKRSRSRIIKSSFWLLWVVLTLIVFNEKFHVFHLAEEAIYVPTFGLMALHLYNRRQCQCNGDDCCVEKS